MKNKKPYLVADFDKIKATPCPCGESKRAFVQDGNEVASMHVVEISQESRPHYHKKMTEIYYSIALVNAPATKINIETIISVTPMPKKPSFQTLVIICINPSI